MIDKGLHFGLQNFIFLKSDETDGTFNYYLFQDKKGASLIMRTNKTASEAKYFLGTGDVDTIWAAKATNTYAYPSAIGDPTV